MAANMFVPLTTFRRRIKEDDIDEERLIENMMDHEFGQQACSQSTSEVGNTVPTESGNDYSVELRETGQQGSMDEITTITRTPSPWKKFRLSYLGILLTLLASAAFSGASLFIKLAASLPSLEAVFMRLSLQVVFSLPFLIFYGDVMIHPWKKTRFLILRSLTGVISIGLNFYAIKRMALADARVLFFTSPVFTAILARIFLKESINKFDVLAMLFSFGGVVLIGRPTFIFGSQEKHSESKTIWITTLLALVGAVFGSCSITITRKISREVGARVVVFYFSVIGSFISLIASLAFGTFKFPDCGTFDALYLIISGVFGYIAQILVTKALSLEKAAIVSLTRTVGIVFSFTLQLLVLRVAPDGLSLGGAALILLGNVSIFIKKKYGQKKAVPQEPQSG